MRIPTLMVLALFGASAAYGQAATPTHAAASTDTTTMSLATPLATPPQGVAARPHTAPPPSATAPAASASEARAVLETPAERRKAEDPPRKRSRVLWILVGAVAVLGLIVAVR